MEIIILIAAMAVMFYIVAVYYQKSHIISLVVWAVIGFFSLYIVISGVFFFLDQFNMLAALGSCLVIELVAAVALWKCGRQWKTIAISWELRGYHFVLCMVALAVILSAGKYDFFGMGQDQGVYQTKAIEIMYDTAKNQVDFEEYQNLTDEADKQLYQEMLPRFTGFYIEPRLPTFTSEDKLSDVSGYYHGIPTFPAMLALFGTCFGLSNMSQFQTIFFICSLLLLLFGCRNLRLRPRTTYLLLLLYVLSPYVIWVSKSAFTEPFLGVLLAWFFYLATSSENADRHLLFLPVLVFSFYHITCYTLLPMFLCIFVAKYVYTKEKEFLFQGALSTLGFLFGYIVACVTAPQYSYDNSSHIAVGFVNYDNLLWVVGGVCLLVIIGLALFGRLKLAGPFEKFFKSNLCHTIFSIVTVLVLGYILYYGYTIGWHAEPQGTHTYYGAGTNAYFYLTITAFILGTGVFLLPLVLILTCMSAKKVFENEQAVAVGIGFAYLCLFISAFLRKEVPHYYYYSRYLAPFIAPILMYCGIMIDRIKAKYLCAVGILSAVVLLPFDYVLATQKDDTRMSWDILEDLEGIIGENDAIVVELGKIQDPAFERVADLAVRAMTGADLYPRNGTFSDSMVQLLENYDNVYYFGENESFVNYPLVYEKSYMTSQDNLNHHDWLLPFPSAFDMEERKVQLWEIDPSTFDNEPKNINHLTQVGVNEDGSIISTGEQGYLLYGPYMELVPGTYRLRIQGELLDGNFNQDSFLDVVCQQGSQEILRNNDLTQYLDGSQFSVDLSFTVEEAITGCEFRLFVNEGAILKIDSSTIQVE